MTNGMVCLAGLLAIGGVLCGCAASEADVAPDPLEVEEEAAESTAAALRTGCNKTVVSSQSWAVWCNATPAGTQFRAKLTCATYGPFFSKSVYGEWRSQNGSYKSVATCSSGWTPIAIDAEVR